MHIQKIQSNNNYNPGFTSKIDGVYTGHGDDSYYGLTSTLYSSLIKGDRTYLGAIKGLLNDGKNDRYTYVRNKETEYVGEFHIYNDDTSKESIYKIDHCLADELFRDMIVDIARQKGILPGKSIGIQKIVDTYNDQKTYSGFIGHIKLRDSDKVRKLLSKKGFKVNCPRHYLFDDEKAIVKKESDEIKILEACKQMCANKRKIKTLWAAIYKKVSDKCRTELYDIAVKTKKNETVKELTKFRSITLG